MRYVKYRSLKLLCIILATIVLLVACSGGNGNGNDPGSDTPRSPQSSSQDANAGYQDKYDPPVTITTVWGVDPALTFKNGETIEENVATRWALETFGIDIKSLWSITDTGGAFAQKLRLSMTSKNDIPDIVTVGDMQLAQDLISSGMFREVGSLFDQYANDTWKQAISLDENVWNPYVRDGERMGIPILDYAYNHDYMLWIRQDWLDALNLQAPKTIADLENVMEAFKHNNPDGLSPNEVIPLSIGFKDSMNTWMGDPSWIFGAYGTIPQQWNVVDDGQLEYGSINPGIKEGLIKIREWHEKGYIPREAALWDESKTSEPAVAGTAGIIPGPYWMSGWPLLDTVENVETAVWKPHHIPSGPDGKAGRHGTHFVNGVTLINANMERPEVFFTYQNYLFENFANPAPGSQFDLGLFQGYDYDLDANGDPLHLDDIPGGYVNSIRYLLVRDGARIPDAQMKALMNLADGKEPETRLEKEVANNYGPETPHAAVVLLEQEAISMKDMYTGPPTPTMMTQMDYLNVLEAQVFNEIIYSEKEPDAFDEFVATWKSSGGDKITQEVNEWYRSLE